MKSHNYTVLIEKDEDGGYIATVPAIKSCYTQADTIPELLEYIKEVILICLEVEQEEIVQNEFIGVQQVEVFHE
ncbi:MAG: type II toxin-antitoxin system HicB family antitoxin [Defluviitaleaceae bacterium]|nr:type II toxin-antitoxin system HicB family antitoxin [Defluviitaleaceae bacterium]